MKSIIPSIKYLALEKQISLYIILECIYKEIDIVKSNPYFNDIKFLNLNWNLDFVINISI